MSQIGALIKSAKPPSSDAVKQAFDIDLHTLATTHVPDQEGMWPGAFQMMARDSYKLKIARAMLADILNSEAMKVVDATIACHKLELESEGSADSCGCEEDTTAELLEAAELFSIYTCDVVRANKGET